MDTSTPAATPTGAPSDDAARLRARVADLERERDGLAALVEIHRDTAAAASAPEALQAVVRVLARSFGLDRCSVYLSDVPGSARVVASAENPAIRNLAVDLARYPELRRALDAGAPLFIADAASEEVLEAARDALAHRNVGSIAVVPMRWGGRVIGALYLRTDRDAPRPLDAADVRLCEQVADLAAQAVNAPPRGDAARPAAAPPAADPGAAALLAFLQRLLARRAAGAAPLPQQRDDELDRLVDRALGLLDGGAR